MKVFDKESDPNLIKRAIDAGLSSTPGLSIAWELAKALFGNALELRQQKALEWVGMIQENPTIFRQDLLESADFQDGFIVALESYLKLRSATKRSFALKVFTNFAQTENKEQFELERFNTTLSQISSNGLSFLAYVAKCIEPNRQESVNKTLDGIDFSATHIQKDEIKQHIERQNALSLAYQQINTDSHSQIMIPDKPNPLYPTTQSSMGVTILNEERLNHEESINELVSLGIFIRSKYRTTVSNTNATTVPVDHWDYTGYGKKFVNYIDDTE